MGLMRECKWRPGVTGEELQKKWKLSSCTMRNDAAEASRRCVAEVQNPEFVTTTVGNYLLEHIAKAAEDADNLRETKEGLKARDQVAVFAQKWSDIMGASAPFKVELDQKTATPEKARELMRQASATGHVVPDKK